MDDAELIQMRKGWYQSSFVLLEIVKNLVGRETVFLEGKVNLPLLTKRGIPARMIKAHSMSYLQKNFDAFDFIEKPYNLYNSVALFENMPMASFAPEERKKQQDQFFHGVAFDLCFKGFDFFLDIDAKQIDKNKKINEVNACDVHEKIREYYLIDEMYADAKRLKKRLDDFGLPYSVKFSGLKGFHFVIKDSNIFLSNMKPQDKVKLAEKIAHELQGIEDIPSLDLSIYQATRIQKTPYSLEGYLVALPLSDEQFNHWGIEKMMIDKVLQNCKIKERGLLERPKGKEVSEFLSFYGDA